MTMTTTETSNGSTATRATVDVLTAEVRTLMVGSRQITLSVANQLDTVDLDDLDVMGRVNLTKRPGKMGAGGSAMTALAGKGCGRCGRRATVQTQLGPMCQKHGNRLPSHLRKPPRPIPKSKRRVEQL